MKLAFYMTGSYAKVLRRCLDFLEDFEVTALCPNWQSQAEARKEQRFSDIDYLYKGFNELFETIDVASFCEKYASINLYEVLLVDKAHFKKKSGEYQLRYICTVGKRLADIFERTKPEYIFLPIIETNDAMMAYRMAEYFGVTPIVYCHARFTNLSFFSGSHLELLPSYTELADKPEDDELWGREFLAKYNATPAPFDYRPPLPDGEIYDDIGEDIGALGRLLRSIRLKFGVEQHNQMISLWISFQVHFQRFFTPTRNLIFHMVERFYIRPKPAPEHGYDFFPLHFSPESSINVPAPFYIDQSRVVDKILLERMGRNIPLVLKEHPAMYGFRPRGFYKALKNRPIVAFVHRKTPSFELIRKAETVYSVTGTACLEAFFLGVKWVQFGNNFLSAWVCRRKELGKSITPLDFIRDVRSVSRDFVLYSPGVSLSSDKILFARENIEKLCEHLKLHIKLSQKQHAKMNNV